MLNELKAKGQKVQNMQRELAAAATAMKTVTEKPDDPAANRL